MLNNIKFASHAANGDRFKTAPWPLFWVGLVIIIFLAVLLRIDLLGRFRVSYDEAIHLIWLRLLAAGYKPYTEVYITYPPLYSLSIQAVWSL